MRFLLCIDLGRELRRATLRGDAMQAFWSTEENHSLTTPRAATIFPNITQILRASTRSSP